ncbi:MAG: tRNA guanosine(34) transglycosylase Tgt [Cytophagaceae bacterium]|nr:tRNA guanosine(34) transglycosylase Tgt [Cytophagaceae bacterium]MDW8455366.1 tRNA guanosine(34) transglycosylase Tgt [Cytophagaceae bacterium]
MFFQLEAKDKSSHARAGVIYTAHGNIHTPVFMPVGTAGTVKAVHQTELSAVIGAEIILGNTYHLYLRPGVEVLKAAGGLHKFNGWQRPILTDSGGFQVHSLNEIRKISEEGVVFKSHIDGSAHMFTPENVIDIQRKIGADIIMAFDECTPYPCDYAYAKSSMELTHRWLKRCIKRFNETKEEYEYAQYLFPIVQGSVYKDLRKISAEVIAQADCIGNAIGGLSVGEPAEEMYEMTALVCEILPAHKPRYLMGVGTPANLLECVALGIDMFDCVMPTRNARNGMLFTTEGIINIKNEKWKKDFSPIDPNLNIFTNEIYTKAYLRHLIINNEILAAQIASIQNLSFYCYLMQQARMHIVLGDYIQWKKDILEKIMRRL